MFAGRLIDEAAPTPGLLGGKVCLVTGAAAGIGRAVAEAFAREGGLVVATDIDLRGAQSVASAIMEAGGIACGMPLDVTDPSAHAMVLAEIKERFGRLDVACNNAGIVLPRSRVADMPLDDWRKVLSVNLDGVFYGFRAQLPLLVKSKGVVVAMSSLWGVRGRAGAAHYTAAKHGVVGLVKSVSWEYGSTGVRSIAVGPGYIATGLEANVPPEERRGLSARHALSRMGRPAEVAEAVTWLCSPAASFITGCYVPVDGGYLAR